MLRRTPNCKPECGAGDGLSFSGASTEFMRPVAAGRGLAQCQQFCDLEADCRGVVFAGGGADGGACWTVNSTKAVPEYSNRRSYTRTAPRAPAAGDEHPLEWWIAAPSQHVLGAARLTQTAFCRSPKEIQWAAAPGQYAASQLAILSSAGSAQLDFAASALANGAGGVIPASAVELSRGEGRCCCFCSCCSC